MARRSQRPVDRPQAAGQVRTLSQIQWLKFNRKERKERKNRNLPVQWTLELLHRSGE
jgi:hypothetical protein